MRLLNTVTYQLSEFPDVSPLQYATLSRSWKGDDVCFRNSRTIDSASQEGDFAMLRSACEVATALGAQWLWVYSICIDQSSSAEVSEAINSYFRLLRECQFCIVYLDDFEQMEHEQAREDQLRRCQWIQQAWSLPELIATRDLRFFSKQWVHVGTKLSLLRKLSIITQIDEPVLRDANCLFDFSIGRRMSWAAYRSAPRAEDVAYSLIGIFGVHMPIIYGEDTNAFFRLQGEILKVTDDATLFAWQAGNGQACRGLFAHSPREFAHFAARSTTAPLRIQGDISTDSATITINGVFRTRDGEHDLLLGLFEGPRLELGVLFREWKGCFFRSVPCRVLEPATSVELATESPKQIRVKRDVDSRTSNIIAKDLSRAEFPPSSVGMTEEHTSTKPTEAREVSAQFTSSAFPIKAMSASPTVEQLNRISDTSYAGSETAWSVGSRLTDSYVFRGLALARSAGVANTGVGSSLLNVVSPGKPLSRHEADDDPASEYEPPTSVSDCGSETDEQDLETPEDDMHLFATLPPPRPTLDPTHVFASVKDQLAAAALEEITLSTTQPRNAKRLLRFPLLPAPPPKRFKSASTSALPVELDQEIDSEDEDAVRMHHRPLDVVPAFACPFYVRDAQVHRACLTRADLRSVSDVKQHLWIAHRRPPFCPVCYRVFAKVAECNAHVRARTCEPRDGPAVEGISGLQMQMLAVSREAGISDDELWLRIWDITFPGAPRPSQARLTGKVGVLITRVRDYWARKGKAVIARFLEKKKLTGYEAIKDEERGLQGLYEAVLDQMVDTVVGRFAEHSGGVVTHVGERAMVAMASLRALQSWCASWLLADK